MGSSTHVATKQDTTPGTSTQVDNCHLRGCVPHKATKAGDCLLTRFRSDIAGSGIGIGRPPIARISIVALSRPVSLWPDLVSTYNARTHLHMHTHTLTQNYMLSSIYTLTHSHALVLAHTHTQLHTHTHLQTLPQQHTHNIHTTHDTSSKRSIQQMLIRKTMYETARHAGRERCNFDQ